MDLIKVGDLVSTRTSYHPPKMIYGNITEIKDSNGEIHDQYEVITGHGDKNSKLKVNIPKSFNFLLRSSAKVVK
jgi:hypothetical protein